jgi:hypothetical protein
VTEQTGIAGPGHYCRICGSKLRSGTRFCTGCGNDSGAAAAPVTTPPVTTPPVPIPSASPSAAAAPPASRAIVAPRADDPSAAAGRSGTGYTGTGSTGPEYDQPARTPDGRRGGHRTRSLAIAGSVLAVAAAAVLIVVLAHPFGHPAAHHTGALPRAHTAASKAQSTSPTPSSSPAVSSSPASQSPAAPTEQQAAAGVASLLAQSASNRAAIDAAYNDVLQCGPNLAADAQAFQNAETAHQQFLSDLTQLPGRSLLPQAMLSDLVTAWQASASADGDFAQWAEDQVSDGCTADDQSDPNFAAADTPDLQATASKTAFVRRWNPLARAYGLPTYQQNQF